MSNKKSGGSEDTYAHIFAYRVSKKKHNDFLRVRNSLAKIYLRHGTLGVETYLLGKTNVFEGFQGFDKALETTPDEEVWIEVDTYPSASEFSKIVGEIGEDKEAGPIWGELAQITEKRPVLMGGVLVAERQVMLPPAPTLQA